ncbi:MAG: CRISPR-associated helicase Cas3' [Nitrososphaerales archaeon]
MEPFAKSNRLTLSQHTKECIEVANTIIPSLPLSEKEKSDLISDVILGLAFHDIGKAAIGFQKVMIGEKPNWGGKRHEILSASLASSVVDLSEAAIFAILTHHKSIPNTGFGQEERKSLDLDSLPIDEETENLPPWKKMKAEWESNYASFRESWEIICKLIGRNDLVGTNTLSRIRLNYSWLKRGTGPDAQLKKETYNYRRYFSLVRGLLMASDHMASGGYSPSQDNLKIDPRADRNLRAELGKNVHGFQINMGEVKGNAILRAPTGSGKTEASLLWATYNGEENSRLFYVLPNIASINAMYQRLKKIYGEDSVGLLHSRARDAIYRSLASGDDIESKLEDQKNANMLRDVARSIWFPVRVCTPHQILRYSFRGKGWETMLGEFPKALFVFDEIHAYDPRLVGQIIATAKLVSKWKAKCAFLSATMPSFLIKLITQALSEDGLENPTLVLPDQLKDAEIIEKKRHILSLKDGTLLDHLQDIIDDIDRGLRVLVVCNTISTSQQVFNAIRETLVKKYSKSEIDEHIIMLIHSKFTRRDRTEKENRVMKPVLQPRLLVATQVVEVSLDISYNVAYLEPAPIDAIVQRMGRVNRKGANPPAPIYLMTREISARSIYKEKDRVKKTIEELFALVKRGLPLSEQDLVEVAERVYDGGYSDEERDLFNQGLNNRELQSFEEEMIAGASEDWKDQVLTDSGGIDVLPRCFLEDYEKLMKDKLILEAYGLLVPVQWFSKIREETDFSHDPPISHWKYSSLTGFTAPKNDGWDDDLSNALSAEPSNII